MVTCELTVFTPDQLRRIEEQVQRVILTEGCGWGELYLRWERGMLKEQRCSEEVRFVFERGKLVWRGCSEDAREPVDMTTKESKTNA